MILARLHTTLADLMFKAITTRTNTVRQLMRSIGGPAAVRAMIADKGGGNPPL